MFNLRYYQCEAKSSVYGCWDTYQSTAVIAATGTGKTELYLSIAADMPGRVVVLAHRDYLLTQPIRRFAAAGFDDVAVEKAEQKSEVGFLRSKVVFASVQSLSKPNRLEKFDPNSFSCLIVDEGHRATATTYRRVLSHFTQNPRLKVLILTATPKRKDGVALGNVCESVAYEYGPKRASDEGWIVPLRFFRRDVPDLDFSNVKITGGDLDPEQVERLLLEEKPLHYICASMAEDRGPTIAFCPRVGVARAFHELMNRRYRPNRSAVLWQDSNDEERERAGKGLADGSLDYLFNVDIATEGYDVPELARVVWACPTASLVKFTQGTGRVFRPHGSLRGQLVGTLADAAARRDLIANSPKPFGQVVTFYPANCKHQLCDPIDILGGDDLKPDVKAAAKQAAGGGEEDPQEAIDTGEAVVDLRRLLEQRRRELKAKAKVVDSEYDGFGGQRHRGVNGVSTRDMRAASDEATASWGSGDEISPKQRNWFKWKRIEVPAGVTKFRAVVVRDLIEHGVSPMTAFSYPKGQALSIRKKYEEGNSGKDPVPE